MVSMEQIKQLREMTGAGIMNCKRALEETKGDTDAALAILKQQGLAKAEKKAHREVRQGLVQAYIHTGGRIGALVELNCETDFVAHTDEFKKLACDLAMQVAAMDPSFISSDELSEEVDPSQACLLHQPFIRDPQKTVRDIITETIARVGENIKVRRLARFELGKE
ncbi:MAG: elongation factor Ts [Dehalococcoidia bacterium]|jgi:elongation factor Ts|nr:elongation factor Ts [Chloroflexota bacterium]MCK4241920.1 elongation factor Ts [Dehalococcoidia bacterium]